MMSRKLSYDTVEGKRLKWEKVFSSKDTTSFARVSGDTNPIHINQEAAKKRGFNDVIVHGTHALAEISRACGACYFVDGVVATNLEAEFKRAMYHGSTYTFHLVFQDRVEMRGKREVTFRFYVENEDGKVTILGRVKLCFP